MAEAIYTVKKRDPAALLLVGVAIGGIALIVLSGNRGTRTGQLRPGESITGLTAPELRGADAITVPIGSTLTVNGPMAFYVGPGRDCYGFFQVRQRQGDQYPTVMASGVSGIRWEPGIGPVSAKNLRLLVSPNQVQPDGSRADKLTAFPWPGPASSPICGANPQLGPADAILEVYELADPRVDGPDGYASPTCNARVPVARQVWTGRVNFVE